VAGGRTRALTLAALAAAGAGATLEAWSRRRDRSLPQLDALVDGGGHRLRRYEAGTGEPPVVLIHGAGDCAASWLPAAGP
jgi:hypothetical protein